MGVVRRRLAISATLFALALGGCEIPKDPEESLKKAQNGTLRVGIDVDPPWTRFENGEGQGIEAELIRRFAAEIGAKVEWVEGNEGRLVQALEEFELDVLIAGMEAKSPHKSKLGFTIPYFRPAVHVGAAEPIGDKLEGKKIRVRPRDPSAGKLRKQKAEPVVTEKIWENGEPVVAYDFELKARGYAAGPKLASEPHVMVVAPGENALLLRLERFLRARAGEIHAIAEDEARKP